jgi:thioredoxin reductase (NADPH)
MNNLEHHKVIILGSGPAGCTAAIYAARANLDVALITGPEPGGQLTKTNDVENWPGEDAGISGFDLLENMLKQAKRFNTKVIEDKINHVELTNQPLQLQGDNGAYTCDALIIATGASAKYLNLPSEKKYTGRGVSGCAVCDGFFYKNKPVVVIGGGNTAADEALYLAEIAASVTIIHRNENLKIEPVLLEKINNTPKIKIIFNQQMLEVIGDDSGVTGVKIKHVISGEIKELPVAAVFVAIGYKPNTEIFVDKLTMENGYIKTNFADQAKTATNVPGVFAAGDVTDQTYRQAVVAAGFGCMAAIDAKKFLA